MPKDSLAKELEHALKAKLTGEVRFDFMSCALYSTDASNYQIEPVGVVIPRTVEDVAATVEIASRYNVPILPRGGGTSLAGQAVGNALVIDFSKYLNSITAFDAEAKTVSVQPGIYLETLTRRLKPYNLMFGPDPATARVATIGGVIGNNSTGAHSILYGMAGDNLESANAILADGTMLHLSSADESTLAMKSRSIAGEGKLYKSLLELKKSSAEIINQSFPKHWRRASGYSLYYLLRNPMNTAKLLAGSEGTLAVGTEFTLKLVDRPIHTGLVLLQFRHLVSAMEAVPLILEKRPSAIELIDRTLISLTREHPGYASMISFVEGNPEAILAVEFYGDTEAEAEKKARDLIFHLGTHSEIPKIYYALTPEAEANVWQVRRAGLGLLMSRREDYKPITCIEDVSVPVANLANYVEDILSILREIGTDGGFYGHASAGCLHIRPFLNLKTAKGVTVMKELTEQGMNLALKYGGVLSGEHGDGLQRGYLNEKLFGSELYKIMRELKSAFDPQGRLNPGKVVDSPAPTENLRYGADYKALEITTYLDWSADNGFAGGVEMCNGQGLCRKLEEGIMCPSYIATRDEADTTRARANALRAVMSGAVSKEVLTSKQMHDVYDLCISCKACKKECPSAVDAAKMKIEFLAHYHEAHGLPLRDRIFGHIHEISSIAAPIAFLSNMMMGSKVSKWMLSSLGIHHNRSLPRFADETFTRWFNARNSATNQTKRDKVVYFHDTWATYYQPEVGRAAVKILESAGFDVVLVEQRVCCGRPMLSKGMVKEARERAKRNIELLAPYARDGIKIVGTEPSCILTFRDEYLDLLPKDSNAKIVAENSLLLEEFLLYLKRTDKLKISWKTCTQSVFLHRHCHQRALAAKDISLELLRMSGCSVRDSGAGCCGMAGSFGYEKEHYEISKTIGEDRLFPAIRETSADTVIVTTGVSCREQIEHFTGRKPKHIAELLAEQVKEINTES